MRILVTGLGKSGTSALLYCVKSSAEAHFGRPFAMAFEPKDHETLDRLPRDSAIAKILSERLLRFGSPEAAVAAFDRRILILRDPRDNVVSRLLWLIATRIAAVAPDLADEVMAALRRKERDPDAVSVFDLCLLAGQLTGHGDRLAAGARNFALKPLTVMRRFPELFVLRYEDFVDGNLGAASGYLGFPLSAEVRLPPEHQRILRVGRHGDWVDWFTESDRAFYSDAIAGDLAALGYSVEPTRPRRPRIDPAEATGYVERVRRETLARRSAAG